VLTCGLEANGVESAFAKQCGESKQAATPLHLLSDLSRRLNLLDFDVLANSDVRLEELSRHFCASWTINIEGESAAASAKRLHQIDFGRLMKEADAARSSAEERMAYLRKLQEEEEETRRPRRGKW